MGCVELSGFLSGIGGKLADKVFVDEAEHVVVLTTVHRNVLDERQQVSYRTGLFLVGSTELLQTRLQGFKDSSKHPFV